MKTKLKAEKKFLFLSTVIFLLIGTALSVALSQIIEKSLIGDRQKTLINLTVRQMESHLPPGVFLSSDPAVIAATFQELFREISNNNVIRIKAYDLNGQIIFSDEAELIGKSFSGNQKLAKALQGETVSEIEDTDHEENIYEKNLPNLMEVYLPVKQQNMQVGVLEIYYNLSDVNSVINRIQLFVASVSLLMLLIFFASLYLLFKRTSDELERYHQKEVESSNNILKLKDEFVYLAAHELRAPSTAIKGYIEVMEEECKTTCKPKIYLNKIKLVNQELIALINDLLEVARTEAGKINIDVSPQDIKAIVSKEVEKYELLAKEKNISLVYETKSDFPKILTNAGKLSEVLSNLISNAIKYNHVDGKIEIKHEIKDQTIITSVIDTGIGLTEEDKSHLFEKFWRADNEVVASHTGTGLGLFITKELVERMHGKIWVESEPNKGSAFSFSLPIAY